jgi:hypothetical protein
MTHKTVPDVPDGMQKNRSWIGLQSVDPTSQDLPLNDLNHEPTAYLRPEAGGGLFPGEGID